MFFLVSLWLYRRWPQRIGTGFFFGFCLTSIFAFRFFVEIFKEVQEPWELEMVSAIGLNQGQVLSIPFVIIGVLGLLGLRGLFNGPCVLNWGGVCTGCSRHPSL